MSGRSLMLFFIALVMAAVAVLIAQHWVESMGKGVVQQGVVQQVEYTPVVVAAQDIPPWSEVQDFGLTVKNWPKDAVTKDMFTEKSQVIGKIAKSKVFTGEPLNSNRVVDRKGGNVFSLGFSENKRAFTVRVNDVSGVGGFLQPDDHVDILASRKQPGPNEKGTAETLIQDIRILAVDQESKSDDKGKPTLVRSVTLEMTPQQAEKVFGAQEQGSIQLTLRNPTDRNPVMKPETMAGLIVSPPPPPPTGKKFTIYRGMSPSEVQCKGSKCWEQYFTP